MLQINFYPESDKEEFIKAADEYRKIWQAQGSKIIAAIEKYTKLKFTTRLLNGVIFGGDSYSYPLRLRDNYSAEYKAATLVHELMHRLLMDNDYWFDKEDRNLQIHKVIYLQLHDIRIDLFGKKIAEESKDKELSYGNPTHIKAWEWALSFSKQERSKQFKESKNKYRRKY